MTESLSVDVRTSEKCGLRHRSLSLSFGNWVTKHEPEDRRLPIERTKIVNCSDDNECPRDNDVAFQLSQGD